MVERLVLPLKMKRKKGRSFLKKLGQGGKCQSLSELSTYYNILNLLNTKIMDQKQEWRFGPIIQAGEPLHAGITKKAMAGSSS